MSWICNELRNEMTGESEYIEIDTNKIEVVRIKKAKYKFADESVPREELWLRVSGKEYLFKIFSTGEEARKFVKDEIHKQIKKKI